MKPKNKKGNITNLNSFNDFTNPTNLKNFKNFNNLKDLKPLKPLKSLKNADGEKILAFNGTSENIPPFKEDSENVPPFKGDKGGFSPPAPECEIFYFDLYGTRKEKFEFLKSHSLEEVPWQKLDLQAPNYFFVPKDFSLQEEYDKGFQITELMKVGSTGIETRSDSIAIQFTEKEIFAVADDFKTLTEEGIRVKYKDAKDSRDWKVTLAKNDIIHNSPSVNKISYRPLDFRFTLYTGKTRGFMGYPFDKVMRQLINKENVALCVCRQYSSPNFQHVFVTDSITDKHAISDQTNVFPLYLYPEEGSSATERRVNMNPNIIHHFSTILSKDFNDFKNLKDLKNFKNFNPLNPLKDLSASRASFSPIDLLDYIYGILHSPTYRSRYKEFLKIDFPRIPYPNDADEFEHYRFYGTQLRQLHLMQTIPPSPVTFPQSGNMTVEYVTPQEKDQTDLINFNNFNNLKSLINFNNLKSLTLLTIRINSTQYFDNVPKVAWEFWIGGYQPALKWLKDRKNRKLSFNDVVHYQNLIAILFNTNKITQRI